MLMNDPSPGTRIKFIRQIDEIQIDTIATLVGPVPKYRVERPEHQFTVELADGMRIVVRRGDIERAVSFG